MWYYVVVAGVYTHIRILSLVLLLFGVRYDHVVYVAVHIDVVGLRVTVVIIYIDECGGRDDYDVDGVMYGVASAYDDGGYAIAAVLHVVTLVMLSVCMRVFFFVVVVVVWCCCWWLSVL